MTKGTNGVRRGSGRPPAGERSVRDALLRAAATHFSTFGYAGTSTRAVLADAGATAPAMYHHFGNKTGLYIAAATAAQEHVLATFSEATSDRRTLSERLSALLTAAMSLRLEHANVARYLSVIQQDVARHPELSALADYKVRFDRFWDGGAAGAAPGTAIALRAVVEGLLGVGGSDLSTADIVAAASALISLTCARR